MTGQRHGRRTRNRALAVERHATSKLPDDDLVRHQATLGFRGEALPSIGAVSRLTLIVSRPAGADDSAWTLIGRRRRQWVCHSLPHTRRAPGSRCATCFYATPARLKFLKAERTEVTHHATDTVNRLAMAHPSVAFSLADDNRERVRLQAAQGDLLDARLDRLAAIMGWDFAENSLAVQAEREGLVLTGHAGLPTLNRGTAQMQYLFVNGRPVRDRLLHGAVRGAYQDSWRATATPWWRCSSRCRRKRSTSTSTRPRRRCASATPAWCAA